MSIVFGAITPHPPILIPTIGRENLELLEKTVNGLKKLQENLADSKAETILIISPHGFIQPDCFTMNLCPEYHLDFEDFGDFSTKLKFKGDIKSINKIKEALETKAALQLVSEPRLDHGCGVPLYCLTKSLKNIEIIPLYFSGLSLRDHFEFGQLLKQELVQSKEKFAIIASGDMSHRLTKSAPAGYSPKAAKFDQKLIEFVKNKKIDEILNLNENFIEDAGECGLRSILILLGILDGMEYETEIISYEGPFGVGYLTANFKF
ncbi:MAG: AmmeMemoRadiSam system protein B [Patescibacteria group bacterium]|nr:AmmeMemoRadiSam system protein B [Patescibacteria group bacterium]MDD4610360.1 AmmeMemoRadiSam system protein B [Patescibacteria group bacterium]